MRSGVGTDSRSPNVGDVGTPVVSPCECLHRTEAFIVVVCLYQPLLSSLNTCVKPLSGTSTPDMSV